LGKALLPLRAGAAGIVRFPAGPFRLRRHGSTDDLIYVSPKSGRAVSRAAGEPYKDKMLRLPMFLHLSGHNVAPNHAEILDSLRLTGYFMDRWLLAPTRNACLRPGGGWLRHCQKKWNWYEPRILGKRKNGNAPYGCRTFFNKTLAQYGLDVRHIKHIKISSDSTLPDYIEREYINPEIPNEDRDPKVRAFIAVFQKALDSNGNTPEELRDAADWIMQEYKMMRQASLALSPLKTRSDQPDDIIAATRKAAEILHEEITGRPSKDFKLTPQTVSAFSQFEKHVDERTSFTVKMLKVTYSELTALAEAQHVKLPALPGAPPPPPL